MPREDKGRLTKIIRSLVVGLLILLTVIVASVVAQLRTDAARRDVVREIERQTLLSELKEKLYQTSLINLAYQRSQDPRLLNNLGDLRGLVSAQRDTLLAVPKPTPAVRLYERTLDSLVTAHERHLAEQYQLFVGGRLEVADTLNQESAHQVAQRRLFDAIGNFQASTERHIVHLYRRVSWWNTLATTLQILGALGLLYIFLSIYRKLRPLISDLYTYNLELKNQEATNQALIDNLRETNLDLDHFAYIASHDLQEPLRTISNFIEVFREDYGEQLDEQANAYFGFLLRATDRMRDLINNLLAFSHIGQEDNRTKVDLNEVVNSVLEALALRIEESGADITVDPLPTVSGFPIELFQLFQNLLTNALKFTRPGQRPTVNIYATRSDTYHRIAVEDQGIGISEADQNKIFRMFSRINAPASYSGEGIGLAFCRKIVKLHGGTLTVDSTPGRGSTFYISLPRTVDNETKTSQDPPSG